MTPMACVFGACIHLWDSLGSASDLLVVHLYKLGVRPFPVRKEVDMKTKNHQTHQELMNPIQKRFLKKVIFNP